MQWWHSGAVSEELGEYEPIFDNFWRIYQGWMTGECHEIQNCKFHAITKQIADFCHYLILKTILQLNISVDQWTKSRLMEDKCKC